MMAIGEGLRLWAVGHIGRKSRTREDSVGELAKTGPYAHLRNPLYVGNLLLFAGIGVVLWPWMLSLPLMILYYQQIIRWEEENLLKSLGEPYRRYLEEVPRWGWKRGGEAGVWNGREALRSERSTLLAVGVVLLLLGGRSLL